MLACFLADCGICYLDGELINASDEYNFQWREVNLEKTEERKKYISIKESDRHIE